MFHQERITKEETWDSENKISKHRQRGFLGSSERNILGQYLCGRPGELKKGMVSNG